MRQQCQRPVTSDQAEIQIPRPPHRRLPHSDFILQVGLGNVETWQTGYGQEFMPFWACKCSRNWRKVILIAIWAFVCTFMRSNCPCKSTSTSTRRCIWRMQLVSCLKIAVTSITRAKHFWVKTLWRLLLFSVKFRFSLALLCPQVQPTDKKSRKNKKRSQAGQSEV